MSPSPHDRLFKQLIQSNFIAFLALFLPTLHEESLSKEVDWLDKEAFLDLLQGERRESDLLASIETNQGRLLVLIELEDREGRTRRGDSFPERLSVYYALLWARYRVPIVPVVIYLLRSRSGRGRGALKHVILGEMIATLTWEVIGLPQMPARRVLAGGGAMAGAFAALMDPEEWRPAVHKIACLDVIARSEDSDALKYIAVNCVHTYLSLDPAEARVFNEAIRQEALMRVEEITETWADRIFREAHEKGLEKGKQEGRERGLEQGREQGLEQGIARGRNEARLDALRETVCKLAQLKFGPLSETVREQIMQIDSVDRLDQLAERVLFSSSLDDLGI